MRKIAVIEDDVPVGNMLEEVLRRDGYEVLRAYSGTEALYLLDRHTPDLVLLDLMLPGLTGEEILPRIKNIPVIILSAKVDVRDKVDLLLKGAVDYMTKPFNVQELLARIKVHLRSRDASASAATIAVGNLLLDTRAYTVAVGDKCVQLTRTEYAILKLLMQNPGQVISKSLILDRISEDTPDCTDHSLKQHVSNLRKKLRKVNDRDYVEAVWGIGFKLADMES